MGPESPPELVMLSLFDAFELDEDASGGCGKL